MNRFVVISGCSGGGKSTLLAELARRGHAVVDEPGRRIVARELLASGEALPWVDAANFARKAIEMAIADRAAAPSQGQVFFDRGLVDAVLALAHATGTPPDKAAARLHRYNRMVFLTPPWREIYRTDKERRHSFEEAVAEYDRLLRGYREFGYEARILPLSNVGERADYIISSLTVSVKSFSRSSPSDR